MLMTTATLDPPKTSNPKYFQRVLSVLHPPGSTVEVRILGIPGKGRPHNAVGYYRDFAKAGRDIAEIEKQKPDGIYLVMNRISDDLFSRSPDLITEYPKATATDADVVRRQQLLIDVDPARPSGVSSTDAELQAAEHLAADIRDWLVERMGWLEPIEAMSGNGWHLLFGIDLPNDESSKTIVENILKAAKNQAENRQPDDAPRCSVDTTVFNAARIVKLYGTMAGKGFDTPERPHRRSYLAYVPDHLGSWEGSSCGA